MIPNLIHLIWFGGFPKTAILENIQNTAKNNPDYSCSLWSSRRTLNPADWDCLEQWCKTNRLILKNVDEILYSQEELTNKELINAMLEYSIQTRRSRGDSIEFWRAASDLLRISLMIKYAGFYFDVRTQINPLGQVEAPYGCLVDFGEKKSDISNRSLNPKFHVFAANKPNLDIFVEAAKVQKTTLDIAQADNALMWKDWLSNPQPLFTILLTGSPMRNTFEILGFGSQDKELLQFPPNLFSLREESTFACSSRDKFTLWWPICAELENFVDHEKMCGRSSPISFFGQQMRQPTEIVAQNPLVTTPAP